MIGGWAALMKAMIPNATLPTPAGEAPGSDPDIYLEIEPQGPGKLFRLPVQLSGLSAEEVVVNVAGLPHDLQAESLVEQSGRIYLPPDGFSKDAQLRTTVVWFRQEESGSPHCLLGLDLKDADFRFRRSLENLLARPKDISDLWRHWDRVQTKVFPGDSRFIFYLCLMALLVGVALQFVLPDSYQSMANILILFASLAIAGKCLWHWWRERGLPAGAKNYRAGNS
jgi:hypothetical protein